MMESINGSLFSPSHDNSNEDAWSNNEGNDLAEAFKAHAKNIVSMISAKIEKRFLICQSCFWCATCLNPSKVVISNCPCCRQTGSIESIPLSLDEKHTIDRRGEEGGIVPASHTIRKSGVLA